MEDLINEQILENIFEEIQENYPNLSEQDKQQLTYKTFEEQAQWHLLISQTKNCTKLKNV